MYYKMFLPFVFVSVFISGCSGGDTSSDRSSSEDALSSRDIYIRIKIEQDNKEIGDIVCRLFADKTPVTVENFIGLAEGKKKFKDISSGEITTRPYYNGLIFHRVIPGFMIQGGCPRGDGRGGPGYYFKDEILEDLVFDKAGKLAMANAGPGTNGSQFFITVAPALWLNGKHTIFGEVTEGQDKVNLISKVARDGHDRPIVPVIIREIAVVEKK